MKWRVSATQIKSVRFCPYSFYLKYVKKVTPETTPELEMGKNIHDTIFTDLMGERKLSITRRIHEIVGPEFEIEPKVSIYTGSVTLSGYPDIVTSTSIYDIKTTSTDKLQHVYYDDIIQMAVYQIITNKQTYLIKIPRSMQPVLIVHKVDPEQRTYDEIFEWSEKIYEIIKGAVPEPRIGSHCLGCTVRNSCRYFLEAGYEKDTS